MSSRLARYEYSAVPLDVNSFAQEYSRREGWCAAWGAATPRGRVMKAVRSGDARWTGDNGGGGQWVEGDAGEGLWARPDGS